MKKNLSAADILFMLENPSRDGIQIRHTLLRSASVIQLMEALQCTTTASTRQTLCDILGDRHAKRAVRLLITMSTDTTSIGVQCSAIDALAKIGDPRAGAHLLDLLATSTQTLPVFSMIVVALGAVRYTPAIPALIALLDDDREGIRGGAVWSLGHLRARDAFPTLTAMQRTETSPYVQARLREALHT